MINTFANMMRIVELLVITRQKTNVTANNFHKSYFFKVIRIFHARNH